MTALRRLAEVRALRPVGDYWSLVLAAPEVAAAVRPGQFVAVAVGGDRSAMLARRSFSVAAVAPAAGTVEVVFAVVGHGTAWLAARRVGERVDLVGPLGRPFAPPPAPAACLLVGGGYGAAPLVGLAAALRGRGCRVDAVLGAATRRRLYGLDELTRLAASVAVSTDDGSAGHHGRVVDLLAGAAARGGASAVYACGPMPMLAATGAFAARAGLGCQVAVEEAMACGIGVCMTCVLPVVGDDGVTRMTRCCVEGPVFAADRVRFADVGTVPAGTEGAGVGAVR